MRRSLANLWLSVGVAAMATAPFVQSAWSESLNDQAAGDVAGGIASYFDAASVYSQVIAKEGAAGGVANVFVDGSSFSNVVGFTSGGGPYCTGTLINSRTVVTAAHCGVAAGDMVSFTVSGTTQTTQAVATSSSVANAAYASSGTANDIRLVSLATPVTAIKPASVATATPLQSPTNSVTVSNPASLVGRQLVSVGFGNIGTGSNCCQGNDAGVRLVTTSTIGKYAAGSTFVTGTAYDPKADCKATDNCVYSSSSQIYYAAQFQNLNTKTPNPNPNYFGLMASATLGYYMFEGATASGDSGGPVFVMIGAQLVQIGELGGGGSADPSGKASQYGDVGFWTPITLFSAWLDQNNPLRSVTANSGNFNWSQNAAWTDSVAGVAGVAPNNKTLASYATGARFYQVGLSNPGTITLDMNPTIDTLSVSGAQSQLALPTGFTLTTVLSTSLSAGTLNFAGGALSSPEVGVTGGLLTGYGTITAAGSGSTTVIGGSTGVCATGVCNTGGTVAPRGVLTIAGNYTQGPGGALSVTAGSAGADRLAVTGTAALDGALQVQLGQLTGPVKGDMTSPIVTANEVTGSFASTTAKLSTFVGGQVKYFLDGVELTLVRSASYRSVANSDNQRSFAGSLDRALAAGTPSPDMNSILGLLDGAQSPETARQFYDQADADGGEEDVVGNQLLANLTANRIVGGALDRHLEVMNDDTALGARRAAGLHGLRFDYGRSTGLGLSPSADDPNGGAAPPPAAKGPASAPKSGVVGWAEAIGGWQALSGDDNAYGLSQMLGGFVGGVDLNPFAGWDPGFKGGVAFSYLRGALGRGSETGATNAYSGYAYATQPFGRAYVEGRAGFGVTQMSTVRQITALDLDRTAYGSTTGNDWSAAVGAGYRFSQGLFNVEPSVRAAWDQVGRRAYTERGADALNLIVDNSALNALQFSAGLRINADFVQDSGLVVKPELRVRYAYDALDLAPTSTASLVGMPDYSFSFDGVNPGRSAAVLGASLTVSRPNSVAVFVDYNAELRRHETVQALMGGVRLVW